MVPPQKKSLSGGVHWCLPLLVVDFEDEGFLPVVMSVQALPTAGGNEPRENKLLPRPRPAFALMHGQFLNKTL